MERQNTGWGHIDWLVSPESDQRRAMRVGIVSIDPLAHMPAHMHFDEQIIYTFQGDGYSLINGKRIPMSALQNNLLHWTPGVIHEMVNLTEQPYVHLMVTCSDQLFADTFQDYPDKKEEMSFQERLRCLYEAIDAVQKPFLEKLRYSFVIYDLLGNTAITSRAFPKFCCRYCKNTLKDRNAPCMNKSAYPLSDRAKSFVCPGGLTVLMVPVLFHGDVVGYVEGGYVYTQDPKSDTKENASGRQKELPTDQELYLAPISSVENSRIMLQRIASMLCKFCEVCRYQRELQIQEQKLESERRDREQLQTSLKNIESSMINLKINNHFLFNSLNQMAAMALDGGVIPLYHSIVNLSKLFLYTLRQEGNLVSLARELDYIKSYLYLQKQRYEDHLLLQFEIQVDAEQWMVPFNWLMPLAENAFLHGMKAEKEKRLWIKATETEGWLQVIVGNQGVQLDESLLHALRIRMRGNTTHGMSMVYQKLKHCYGDQFVMDITSNEQGTEITTMFPNLATSEEGGNPL